MRKSITLILLILAINNLVNTVNDNIIQLTGRTDTWDASYGTMYSDIVYDESSNLAYDLVIPANASKTDDLGMILFIHGGGWIGGDKEEIRYFCYRYAKEGYITAAINFSSLSINVSMEMILDDIEASIAHIKDKTVELGYNVDKLAIAGTSSGGHLTLLYAYSRQDTSPIPIKFIFEQTGATNFHLDSWDWDLDDSTIEVILRLVTGVEVVLADMPNNKLQDLINSVSPVYFVNENTVPTIIAYGGQDNLISLIHRDKLVDALEENGVTYVLVDYPNSLHYLYNDEESAILFTEVTLEYCRTYFGY